MFRSSLAVLTYVSFLMSDKDNIYTWDDINLSGRLWTIDKQLEQIEQELPRLQMRKETTNLSALTNRFISISRRVNYISSYLRKRLEHPISNQERTPNGD